MKNQEIIEILKKISFLLQVKGESSFKSSAYLTAAEIIEHQNLDIIEITKNNGLSDIKGFGKALVEKITEYVETGKMSYFQNLIQEIPESLIQLSELDGLGPRKINILFKELNIIDKDTLKIACLDNKIANLKGFGSKTQINLLNQL